MVPQNPKNHTKKAHFEVKPYRLLKNFSVNFHSVYEIRATLLNVKEKRYCRKTMKKITFYGPVSLEGAIEKPKTIRIGTRAIIERDGKILFSYLGKRHQYLLPGGGMKKGETPKTNAIREVQEECGLIIEPQEPFLVIDECYGDFMYRDYYCKATITSTTATNYDEGEIKLGLEPRWLDMETILKELTTFEITPVDLVGA